MSVQAMSWVFEKSRQKGSSFVVLLVIANYAHKDGSNAFPGLETIARDARITVRQVSRIIPALERSGELIVEHGKGPYRTNRYTVNMQQFRLDMDKMSSRQMRSLNVQQSIRNQKIEPSPLPPTAAGGPTAEVVWGGKRIEVQMGRRSRLPSLESYQGARPELVADFLTGRGFPARILEEAS